METKALKSRFTGAAIVEMAVVLPLLFLLVFGIIQYGWLFLKIQQMTNAARSGARVGVVGDNITEISANVTATVDKVMADSGLSASGYQVIPDLSVSSGDPVTVTVFIPDAQKIALINAPELLPVPAKGLKASVTMAKEGPL